METLSDKIIIETVWEDNGKKRRDLLTTDDVKDFIRELKEELIMLYDTEKHINELVDKLAGDKLI